MYVKLRNVYKNFGSFRASDNVSFEIEKGTLAALLGPSGSGKTTILRMIAGLERQDTGDIYIDGRLVNDLPASQRGIGFVFQNYALFPYLNVFDNIAYGLKIQRKNKEFIRTRVAELLELVGLPEVEKRYPEQLSGGQKQRIALARALAPNPELLLLDEPFAAIDAKVRKELRTWLRETIDKVGITSIFVTHDQEEAIEVADEIVITNNGRVEQVGGPSEIYLNPQTAFVATFIGQSAVIEQYSSLKGFDHVKGKRRAVIRPEFIEIHKFTDDAYHDFESAMEDGIVREMLFRGNSYEVIVRVKDFLVTGREPLIGSTIKRGDSVKVFIKQLYVFDDKNNTEVVTNRALNTEGLYYI